MANLTFDFLHNYVTGERRASDPADAYQYDEGHVLEAVVPVAVTSCEIQYWIRGMEKADAYTPTSITQNTDNTYTILGNIPNSYFETNGDLRVYIVVTDGDASITTYEGYIHIKERQMPEDYVDDDPDNEAVRVIAEARAAAATATEKAGEAAESAEQAQEILDSIPEDYSQLSEDVSDLKDGFEEITVSDQVIGANLNDEVYELGRFTAAGAEFSDTSAFRSVNYLPITGGKTIVAYCSQTNFIRIVQYNSSKEIIVATTSVQARPSFYTAQLVLNANTAYIRFDTYGSIIGASMAGAKIAIYYLEDYLAQYLPYESPYSVIKIKNPKTDILKSILSGGINVKLVGDSITQGIGGTGFAQDGDYIGDFFGEPVYRNPHGYCWANMFENYLESDFSCNVVNNGVLGTSFVELNNSFDTLVSNNDDVVICSYGTNNRADINALSGIVKNCLKKFRDANIDVIFMLPIPASVTEEETHPAHIDQVCNKLKQIFIAENAPYVDVNQIVLDYCELKGVSINSLLSDGLHPNDAGYLVIFKAICKGLGITRKVDDATW